jgi:hypothetical protein
MAGLPAPIVVKAELPIGTDSISKTAVNRCRAKASFIVHRILYIVCRNTKLRNTKYELGGRRINIITGSIGAGHNLPFKKEKMV